MFELMRRELQLKREIACHELASLLDDNAPIDQIDMKLEECESIKLKERAFANVFSPGY